MLEDVRTYVNRLIALYEGEKKRADDTVALLAASREEVESCKKQIAEWVLIADFRKRTITMIVAWRWKLKLHLMNRLWARRTNTVKIECKLRRTRNANRWMKWFTRKIQITCNSILTWRFTDSSSRESLLNQRMSDSMYHNRWNELMKQMSLMKEYLKCMKQWPLR